MKHIFDIDIIDKNTKRIILIIMAAILAEKVMRLTAIPCRAKRRSTVRPMMIFRFNPWQSVTYLNGEVVR